MDREIDEHAITKELDVTVVLEAIDEVSKKRGELQPVAPAGAHKKKGAVVLMC